MTAPDQFDACYADARDRLLTLTYCLTGDLPAARTAVREAFVEAWQHWRKVGRLDDPEGWVRGRACAHAQRRHTAKPWHRDKGVPDDVHATLDALGTLAPRARRVLLLTELTTASLPAIGREVGLARPDVERELQLATARLAVARAVPSTTIRHELDRVGAHVRADVAVHRWPRATILRRAGTRRRRTRTAAGALATAAALVVAGLAVSGGAGIPGLPGVDLTLARDAGSATTGDGPSATPVADLLPADALLDARQTGRLLGGRRGVATSTGDGTAGDGLAMPCQTERFADPHPRAALVRTFRATGTGRPARAAAELVQTAQLSAGPRAADRAYRTAVSWFATCRTPQAQLLDVRSLPRVGDEATLLVLRSAAGRGATVVAGVARTGLVTTATTAELRSGSAADTARDPARTSARVAGVLAAAVDRLCGVAGAGRCAGAPVLRPAAPPPAAPVPAMLAEVDLPPVAGVERPWVGTDPRPSRRAGSTAAATPCDGTDFSRPGFRSALTRTFLVPGAGLPPQFGLTETVADLPGARAAALVRQVRDRLAGCADRRLGTHVRTLADRHGRDRDLAVWHVSAEISDHASVEFLMGVVRERGSVAQVGFVPVPHADLRPDAFVSVVERAAARLAAAPAHRR